MPSWEVLSENFQSIRNRLQGSRIDHQSGTEGDHWRLAGVVQAADRSMFEAYSKVAGKKLLECLPADSGLATEIDHEYRWYRYLEQDWSFLQSGAREMVLDEAGKEVGWIRSTSVNTPVEASAAKCIALSANFPDSTDSPGPNSIHVEVSGTNARFNVNSVDQSSNTATTSHTLVFEQIRQVIESSIPPEDRDALLAAANSVEESAGSASYAERYKEFIALASAHMSLLGQFIPALSELLK